MINLVSNEFLKLKRSKILIISFLGALITPLMMFVDVIKIYFSNPSEIITLSAIFDSCLMYTMLLFGFMMCVVIGAYIFSREYKEDTLKTILPIPLSKNRFMISKFITLFILIMVLMLISWGTMLILSNIFHIMYGLTGFNQTIILEYLIKMVVGGIFMFLVISPFIFLAIWTKGLIMPIIAATTILMGSVGLLNESLGALYPWTSTYLLINNSIEQTGYSSITVIGIILTVSIIGFIITLRYFQKEDITN